MIDRGEKQQKRTRGVPEGLGQRSMAPVNPTEMRKRRSGIPTGHAGEYLVMGELLRRGFDAQLADRNTAGYDVVVGRPESPALRKVQVKTVRSQPWYVRRAAFTEGRLAEVTVYVLLGPPDGKCTVRYFIAKNRAVSDRMHVPPDWPDTGFMPLRALLPYEDHWENVLAD